MGTGSTQNGRDSNAKRLGIKAYGGELVTAGSIIVRQRGSRFKAGFGTDTGRDYTIYATMPGVVRFRNRFIDVVAVPEQAESK
jgi:large subunit ribosomal protein L27